MSYYQVTKTPGLSNDWVALGQIVKLERFAKFVTIGNYEFESLRLF